MKKSRLATADRLQPPQAGAAEMRRGGGLRRMPDLLPRLLDPAARRRGLAAAKLLTEWPAIVGPALAARCQPIRLGQGGVLVLHVAGTAALELQHSEPQVLERINGFFGYPAVARLRLIQAPLPRRAARPAAPVDRSLSEAEERQLTEAVVAIGDPDLRAALADLGRALKRSRHPDRPAGAR